MKKKSRIAEGVRYIDRAAHETAGRVCNSVNTPLCAIASGTPVALTMTTRS